MLASVVDGPADGVTIEGNPCLIGVLVSKASDQPGLGADQFNSLGCPLLANSVPIKEHRDPVKAVDVSEVSFEVVEAGVDTGRDADCDNAFGSGAVRLMHRHGIDLPLCDDQVGATADVLTKQLGAFR